jgi:hypothetical protein
MNPKRYLEIKTTMEITIESLRGMIHEALTQASHCPIPANLRPATPADVMEGAVMWFPEWSADGRQWSIVSSVYDVEDPWKAWMDEDGSRHGLRGAFIEVNAIALAPATLEPESTRDVMAG